MMEIPEDGIKTMAEFHQKFPAELSEKDLPLELSEEEKRFPNKGNKLQSFKATTDKSQSSQYRSHITKFKFVDTKKVSTKFNKSKI